MTPEAVPYAQLQRWQGWCSTTCRPIKQGPATLMRAVSLSGVNAMAPTQLFAEESVTLTFRKLFPPSGFRTFPFDTYIRWRASKNLDWHGTHSRLLAPC